MYNIRELESISKKSGYIGEQENSCHAQLIAAVAVGSAGTS